MTTAVATPTLYQFVAAQLSASTTNFHEEAERLLRLIPEADRESYLLQALIPIIGQVTGQRRRDAFEAVGADTDLGEEETNSRAKPTDLPSSSLPPQNMNFARRNRHRDHWASLLDQVGISADGGRKRIAEMGREDLLANISQREKLAATNLARAEEFRTVLKALDEEGVGTVADIKRPPSL